MSLKNLALLFIVLLTAVTGFSQIDSEKKVVEEGRVIVISDDRLDTLISIHKKINKETKISGYRVQISFSSDLNKEKRIRAEFTKNYQDNNVYLEWKAPNYMVQVGDYLDRITAQKLLDEIKKEYKGAFIIYTEINLPKISFEKEEEK